MKHIDTEKISAHLRLKAIDLSRKAILVTSFAGSEQEKDLTEPANCNGFGRVRHFKLSAGDGWPHNPLPVLPACKALGLDPADRLSAQVFQNSVCNWRCWYCFVDFSLLNGDTKHASFLTCDEMLDLHMAEDNRPLMLDLTGGQPDLTPEWVPWMMEAIRARGLEEKIFLWSDDNLSNDYLWQYLTEEQLALMASYKMYSRVCCFKGIDAASFSLNTKADPALFLNQFELCKRLVNLNLDLYCYITLTASTETDFASATARFLDTLQGVSETLPLRVVPLRIFEFTPMKDRMNPALQDAINGQYMAIDAWNAELQKRFSAEQLAMPITNISINARPCN